MLVSGQKWFSLHLCMCAKSLQLCLTLCDLMNVALQAPLSVGFSRQEYWSGLLCPPPRDLPEPGIEPVSPTLAGGLQLVPHTFSFTVCVCVCVCVLATLSVRFSGIKYIHNVVQSSPLSISKTSLSQMIPWTARRSNQSILNEINPEYSLEGLLLKLQYFESEE